MADLSLGERRPGLGLFDRQPLRQALGGAGQEEFSIRARPAKVFDVGAGQAISPHESIAGLSRPTAFERQRPYAAAQRQLTSDHGRGAAAKTVRVLSFDLYAGAAAIGFAGERTKRGCQPIDRRAAQQIILRTQIEIPGDIRTAGSARPLLCFSQRYLPGFVKFAHWV